MGAATCTICSRIVNSSDASVDLVLEPWGEVHQMSPGAEFDIQVDGPEGHRLEVAYNTGSITVWGWPGSTMRLLQNGIELEQTGKERIAVPGRVSHSGASTSGATMTPTS